MSAQWIDEPFGSLCPLFVHFFPPSISFCRPTVSWPRSSTKALDLAGWVQEGVETGLNFSSMGVVTGVEEVDGGGGGGFV